MPWRKKEKSWSLSGFEPTSVELNQSRTFRTLYQLSYHAAAKYYSSMIWRQGSKFKSFLFFLRYCSSFDAIRKKLIENSTQTLQLVFFVLSLKLHYNQLIHNYWQIFLCIINIIRSALQAHSFTSSMITQKRRFLLGSSEQLML